MQYLELGAGLHFSVALLIEADKVCSEVQDDEIHLPGPEWPPRITDMSWNDGLWRSDGSGRGPRDRERRA